MESAVSRSMSPETNLGAGQRARTHYHVTLAVLILAAISYALLQSLVLPALPTIQHSLHVSQTTVTWVLTAYLLGASVGTPIAGRLGDMYGKDHVLVIVLGILALGTLISAVAPSIGVMLVGRLVQGIGGGLFPLGFGIIRDEFPPRQVAGGIGLMSSMIGIGGGAGVVLSGVIVAHVSYHWLFWVPLIVIVAAMVAAYVFVPESPVKVPGHVNWRAASLMSLGITTVLIATSETTSWGWGSPKAIVLMSAGLLLLACWVVVELRSREPLVDMRMMRLRGVWTTNLVAFLVGVGMYSSFILIPEFVQAPSSTGYGFGASVLAAGIFLAPMTLTMLLVGQFTGILDRLVGSRATLITGCGFSAAAFAVLTTTPSASWQIYVASATLGIGVGLAFAALANLIVQNVAQEQTGVATGMNTVMRTLGGALGGQVAATLLAANPAGGGLPSDRGYALAFGMCGGAVVIGGAASLLIPRRRRIAMHSAAASRAVGERVARRTGSDLTERPAPYVVTISAPYGAGGSVVGPRLADRLGVPFLDRAIPREVSARLDVPLDDAVLREELPQGTLSRLVAHFDPAVQMFAGASPPAEALTLDDEAFRTATEQVLHDFAARGGVILGRGAAVVLRDVPHVLSVRLDGPREARVLQAMRRESIDRATAEEEMRAADLSREAYVRHWYHVDPHDPSLYNVSLDSTSIELDACVELIALAATSAAKSTRTAAAPA